VETEPNPAPGWGAAVMVGELVAGDGFFEPKDGAEIVLRCVTGTFYGGAEVTRNDTTSQAMTVDGHEGWIMESDLSFSIPGLNATNELLTDSVGGGTNHPKSGAGPLSMHASLLFTAPYAGTFDCRIRATTSDGANTNYQVTALSGTWPGGTWLELDNFTADPPQSWAAPFCDSSSEGFPAAMSRCIELVASSGKPSTLAITLATEFAGSLMPRAWANA